MSSVNLCLKKYHCGWEEVNEAFCLKALPGETVSPSNAVRIKKKLTECRALLLEAYSLGADDRFSD